MKQAQENFKPASSEDSDLVSLELKANLNPEQRAHLEVLKDKMKKILSGKTKQELAKAGDLPSLKKYKAILGEILQFLKSKKMKTAKNLSFKTMEEVEAVYSPEQIAHNKNEVGEDTKVYIGELYPGIFDELPKDVEHVYTSFPEDKIVLKEITIDGKNVKELISEFIKNGYRISDYAQKMMANKDFKPGKKAEKLDLVILSVKDLGFPNGATRQEIYDKAQKLGLEIVPQEVGPQLRLQYEDQPMDEWLRIGMEPLADSSGDLNVFDVGHNGKGRWLDGDVGSPARHWSSSNRWVFARK